jgi:hypothetical protein
VSPRYRRVVGVTERRVGASLFLANPGRGTVHRVNETVAALWSLLATPATQEEAIATFRQAFPGTPADQVAGDVHTMLVGLLAEGLVEPLP